MNYIQSIILGIIEGITEFFPISSTGHMIIAATIMGILENKITKLLVISTQIGSILSIIFLYRKKIFVKKLDFYIKIFIAILPIGIIGLLVQKKINFFLDNPIVVALSLFIGGLVILKSEDIYDKKVFCEKNNCITYYKSFIIGLFQCISLIPGVSRSATTIVTCMLQNVDRKKSIEFSFFLSVPVIVIATCKKLFDYYFQFDYLTIDFFKEIKMILLGNLVSFMTSLVTIKYFMKYLKNNNFKLFGYYRIFLGIFFIVRHYLINL
ncbi:undecaprenyl-diphosphate phosphatase [Blattabacterium cuenoti]|uniref:undecaprenyl-diphosphate phosphatase n=1 Tax=Blattabacterium cuenoti TaxID=1653831 RepID=UPI00163CBA81|nr:undecaprenyl-diphosphate phosphatase [Blattabacterium cuenoti]